MVGATLVLREIIREKTGKAELRGRLWAGSERKINEVFGADMRDRSYSEFVVIFGNLEMVFSLVVPATDRYTGEDGG